MKEQTSDFDPRIPFQGVAEVPVLPARIGLDHQDSELFLAHGDRSRDLVVGHDPFLRVLGHTQGQCILTGGRRCPHHVLLGLAHGRHTHHLGQLWLLIHMQSDPHVTVLAQGAAQHKGYAEHLVCDAEGRGTHAGQFEVG